MRSARPLQSATSAPLALEADRRRRTRSYLIAMSIRTVSFPLAVWALVSGWMVLGWLLAAAAVLLPSFAVMVANAADRRRTTTGPVAPLRALPPGPAVSGRIVEPGEPRQE